MANPSSAAPALGATRDVATAALKRAALGFQAVTWTYHTAAVAYAVATWFAVLALMRPEVPLEGGVFVVILTTLLSVLFGMGALHVHFKPFVWTVAIAVATTAVTVIHVIGPNPLGLAAFGSAAWSLVAYGLLVPTFWFRRQIAQHKDLYILHHASARTRRSLQGRSPEERHDRLVAAMRRAAGRTWVLSIAIAFVVIVASVAGTWTVVASKRPEAFAPARAQFEHAWNDGGLAAVAALFEGPSREHAANRLAGLAKAHGFDPKLPRLDDGELELTRGRAVANYDVAGVIATATWTLVGTAWELDKVDLPIPAFEPTLNRFLEFWKNAHPEELVVFFAPEVRRDMRLELAEILRRRSWVDLPELLDTEVTPQDESNVLVVHDIEKGKITATWYFHVDGAWHLETLKITSK